MRDVTKPKTIKECLKIIPITVNQIMTATTET